MGRFDGVLLCSDYDGTLAGPDGKVSPENAQAIRYFTENGGLFTLATGRSPGFIRQMCAVLPLNAPVMCLNGGAIVDPESFRVLEISPLPQSAKAILPQLAHPVATYQVDLWYGDCQIIRWRLDSGRPLAGAFDAVPSPLFKAVLINSRREAAERMRDTARETYAGLYRFERSWPEGLEILPANGGKGSALGRIKAHTGAKRTVGIGDFENDVSLLEAADCGIAVANALPCVKQAADLMTVENTQHALRHVICEML